MTTARMKFLKGEEVKYLSHLDLQRTFQRALRRAGIEIAYSQGFNPHPKLSFAMALAVGMTSEGEYVDVELNQPMDPEDLQTKLNQALPKGLQIIECRIGDNKNPSLMSIIRSGLYMVVVDYSEELDKVDIERSMKELLDREEIFVKRRNKRGKIVEKNIRPLIKELKIEHMNGHRIEFNMKLETGSQNNLKPEIVVQELKIDKKGEIKVQSIKVHRIELHAEGGNSPLKNFS